MKRMWIIPLVVVSLSACSFESLATEEKESYETVPVSSKELEVKEQPKDIVKDVKRSEDGLIIVPDPESMTVVVNKNRKLPEGYTPPDLTVPDVPFYFDEFLPKKQMRAEAAKALEELFLAAEADGMDLVAASGYRSYDRQKNIYERNVRIYGEEETNTFSAKPGTSEHQTGLAMDVTSAEMAFKLDQSFRQTDEGAWLAENAHKYGFIIRYPKGKSDITGYTYEPWHLRYIGVENATSVYNQSLTLEEFFGFIPTDEQ